MFFTVCPPSKVKDARLSTFCSPIVNTYNLTLTCKLTPANFVWKVNAGEALNMCGGISIILQKKLFRKIPYCYLSAVWWKLDEAEYFIVASINTYRYVCIHTRIKKSIFSYIFLISPNNFSNSQAFPLPQYATGHIVLLTGG